MATVLALVSGCRAPRHEIIAVHDRLVPDEIRGVQARTHLLASGADVATRLRAIPERAVPERTVVIERAADLDAAGPGALARLESMLRREATVVVGARGRDDAAALAHLQGLLEEPDRLLVLDLPGPATAPPAEHPHLAPEGTAR